MPLAPAEARAASRRASEYLRAGAPIAELRPVLRGEFPAANSTEITWVIRRGGEGNLIVDAVNGFPSPATVTLRYPLPPSTAGGVSAPNPVSVYWLVERLIEGEQGHRVAVTTLESGSLYSQHIDELLDILEFWSRNHPEYGSLVSYIALWVY